MKKFIIGLFITFLVVGCSSKVDNTVYKKAVLLKQETDQAMVVFSNRQNDILFTKSLEIPKDVYFGLEAMYYTIDGVAYESISYSNFKPLDTLKVNNGLIAYYNQNECLYVYDQDGIACYRDNNLLEQFDSNYIWVFNQFAYIMDAYGVIQIRSTLDNQLAGTLQPANTDFCGMVEIDKQLYFVSDYGYTKIIDNQLGNTYLFPVGFQEMLGCRNDFLSVIEDGQYVLYKVSFSEYTIKLDLVLDDEYYENVDFSKQYPDLYGQGYEVEYYQED